MNAIDELCPNCGLCCNGALFADVELRAGDDPKRLTRLGLPIARKGTRKLAFPQACACFDGKLCGIYPDRPKRCRLFECGLLKRVKEGGMEAEAALHEIAAARRELDKIERLLEVMGQTDKTLALTHRYAAAMSAPVDLGEELNAEHYGELMQEMGILMERFEREFLR
jgi:Fe-S-cluster containining protein